MKEGPSAPEGELTKGAGDQPESAEVKQESELKTQVGKFSLCINVGSSWRDRTSRNS